MTHKTNTYKKIIAASMALSIVFSNAAGIIDTTNIFTSNSIVASAADVDYDAMITDVVNSITNDSMTEYQKMSAICKWIAANTNYSEGGMTYEYILENKVGNCVAHTELVNIMAKKAGLQCWCRYAGGISKGMHRNNMALLDGNYYEIDTSYSGDYWGDDSVIKKRDTLFTIAANSDSTDATLISYDENFPEEFTIPSTVKGYNIKTIFDDFSGGSAHIAEYMVGDDRQQWGVKTLNISEGITNINYRAFSNLSKMETVNIPSTVTNIDPTAFNGCIALKNINISSKNTKYSVKDGFLIENGNRIIFGYGCKDTDTVVIPDGITSIANIGHYYDGSLGYTKHNYYIPASVTNIENRIWSSYSDRIFGVPGSYAEEYAKANKLTFIDSTSGIIGTITSSSVQDLTGSFSYTGSEILYNPKVTVDGTVLTKDVDYTVTYNNNTNVGTASYTVTGIGSYDGSVTKTFKISQAEITKSSINISMEDGPFYYTGSAIKPKITITNTVYDFTIKGSKTITLTEGKDYSLNYQQNVNYWDSPYVTITGINNYTGSVKKTFSIEFAVPTPTTTDISTCTTTLSSSSYTYDGTAKIPAITVKNGSTTLKENTDYTVSYSNNVNAGTATAKITGKGNYTGTLSKTYTINKASIGTGTISLSQYSYEYDGAEKKPDVTVKVGSKTLVNGTDYTVTYASNKNAGAATVTATGKGNYSGSMNDTFYITEPEIPEDPEDPKPAVTNISTCTATLSATSYTYDGTAKTPDVTVKNDSADLVNGTDYTVSYSNNINVGTATVTITGKGTYTGAISKTFTISTANINDTEIGISATSYTYSGNACKPNIAVKSGSKTLANGTDYTVEYKNNVNVGTATVTITGKGNYSGSLEKTFTISPASISSATVDLSATSYTYDGSAKKPTVTVKIGEKNLVSGTDYSVVYSNNVKAGSATVKVNGKGNYTGIVSKSYTINEASISSATVALSSTYYSYNESAKTPAVTVIIGAKTLIKDTDYTVTYSNNKNIGTATVKITGKGNYKNTISKSFNIYPANVTGTKTSSIAKNSITISCNKVTGATGYVFYKYNNSTKKWVRISKRTSNSYTFTGLSAGTNYRFTVRAYKTVNGKEILSKRYTSFYTSTIPATVSFTVKSNAKNKATLTWKKVTGATSYIIYYKTSKSGKWKKITTLANSKTSYTKSGLTSGKTYYFTVKAVKNYNGKNYNAKITTKSVKVK